MRLALRSELDGSRRGSMAATDRDERRDFLVGCLAAVAVADFPPTIAAAASVKKPRHPGDALVAFRNAPFPVPADSLVPEKNQPFFDGADEGGRFHLAPRGGKLYEHPTYDDPRSLVLVPRRFGREKPAALVVFFHGNLATLSRDVMRRQKVVAQVEASGLNALLVAPQLAVDALDSSPGRFYEPGFLDAYLEEAAQHLAERSGGRFEAGYVQTLPVILVAYSGGYLATAFCLHNASVSRSRICGVVLFDALFGEEPKIAEWIEAAHASAFFVSAFSPASAGPNAALADDLATAKVHVVRALPRELVPGETVLLSVSGAVHDDFVTQAWTADPLRDLLARVRLGS